MPPSSTRPRTAARRWRDRLIAADPGRFGLRIALRASISLGLSTTALLLIGAHYGLPSTVALVGAELAMMVSSGITDPRTSSQRSTFIIAVLAGAAAVALAALVQAIPWLSASLLCAITFATRRFATTPLLANGAHASLVKRIGEQLVRNCDAVADGLEANRAPSLDEVEPLVAQLASDHGSVPGAALLGDIDGILRELATAPTRG